MGGEHIQRSWLICVAALPRLWVVRGIPNGQTLGRSRSPAPGLARGRGVRPAPSECRGNSSTLERGARSTAVTLVSRVVASSSACGILFCPWVVVAMPPTGYGGRRPCGITVFPHPRGMATPPKAAR